MRVVAVVVVVLVVVVVVVVVVAAVLVESYLRVSSKTNGVGAKKLFFYL